MNHLLRTILATTVALATLFVLLKITYSDETLTPTSPADDTFVFLPFIQNSISPAGAYHCYEYEFGMAWSHEIITLNTDGSSIYAYIFPDRNATGTWDYTPSTEVVSFYELHLELDYISTAQSLMEQPVSDSSWIRDSDQLQQAAVAAPNLRTALHNSLVKKRKLYAE